MIKEVQNKLSFVHPFILFSLPLSKDYSERCKEPAFKKVQHFNPVKLRDIGGAVCFALKSTLTFGCDCAAYLHWFTPNFICTPNPFYECSSAVGSGSVVLIITVCRTLGWVQEYMHRSTHKLKKPAKY